MSDKKRVIGRWYIGETLGKGGYSWVKKGKDIKTNKTVALKFMEKADSSWIKEQAEQVETEIGALKNIRNKNVMKLYAYNLNAQYPTKEKGKFIETILLVLEYAPGGELFDILYYTSKLDVIVARTYFKQIINGLDACHKAQVVHRDLKPQNLLLDSKFNIKITDFGLSKVIKSDSDQLMTTSYVGTRGYQAPELLLKKKYDLKCDIFSTGVILFILLAGYPPFEQASKDDKWFKPLAKSNYAKFWKAHQRSMCYKDADARDLIQSMLEFDPKKRASMDEIKNHKWFKGSVMKQNELIGHIQLKHRQAEEKRRQDVKKMEDLNHSLNPNRDIEGLKEKVQMTNFDMDAAMAGAYHTYGNKEEWIKVYNFIEQQLSETGADVVFNFEEEQLEVTVKLIKTITEKIKSDNKNEKEKQKIEKQIDTYVKFYVKVYVDDKYKKPIKDSMEDDVVYAIDVRKISGNFIDFMKIKNTEIGLKCSAFIKGLPTWVNKIENNKKNENQNDDEKEESKENDQEDDDDDEEYYKIMENEYLKTKTDKKENNSNSNENVSASNSNGTDDKTK